MKQIPIQEQPNIVKEFHFQPYLKSSILQFKQRIKEVKITTQLQTPFHHVSFVLLLLSCKVALSLHNFVTQNHSYSKACLYTQGQSVWYFLQACSKVQGVVAMVTLFRNFLYCGLYTMICSNVTTYVTFLSAMTSSANQLCFIPVPPSLCIYYLTQGPQEHLLTWSSQLVYM